MDFARPNIIWGGMASFIALAIDQGSKVAVLGEADRLTFGLPIFPNLDLVLVRNDGVTFGLLGQVPWWGLSLVAMLVCLWLMHMMFISTSRIEALGCGMIIGGAFGNVIDRVRFGGVTDFLDFYVGAWHWPAFNLADVAVVCGASLLVLYALMDIRGTRSS